MSDETLIDTWAPPHGPGPSTPIDPLQAAHDDLNALLGVGQWSIYVGSRETRPAITLTWYGSGRTNTVIAGSLGEIVAGVREQLQPAPVPVPCALCMAWWVDEDRGPNACSLCHRTAP